MNKQANYIVNFLVVIALCTFIGGVIYIFIGCGKNEFPSYFNNLITGISTVLSTNLAAMIALADTKTLQNDNTTLHYKNAFKIKSAFKEIGKGDNFRVVSSYIYLLSLVAVSILFAVNGFKETDINAMIPQFANTLAGLVVGALSIRLGLESGK